MDTAPAWMDPKTSLVGRSTLDKVGSAPMKEPPIFVALNRQKVVMENLVEALVMLRVRLEPVTAGGSMLGKEIEREVPPVISEVESRIIANTVSADMALEKVRAMIDILAI